MSIELSLCVCVWNTSHLLRRSVHTLLKQNIDPSKWEMIVIDDNSQDDVEAAIAPLKGKINLRYERLEHSYGMRGCTVAFNTAFGLARGNIIAETTAESLLPTDAISQLLLPHKSNPRCFVALKTYVMSHTMQLAIDTEDWQSNILNLSRLPGWNSNWCQINVPNPHFGTHMICSIRKDVWFEITNGLGFPLFADYGSEDQHYCLTRKNKDVQDITLPVSCMGVHQWHETFTYWQSKGRGWNLNKFSHSMANYLGDKSGHVPEGGTCMIWDNGSHEMLGQADKDKWSTRDKIVIATGVPRDIVFGGNDVRVKA